MQGWNFPSGPVVKNQPSNAGDVGLIPGLRRYPWRRKWQPTPVFLLGKSHGQRTLASLVHRAVRVGYN